MYLEKPGLNFFKINFKGIKLLLNTFFLSYLTLSTAAQDANLMFFDFIPHIHNFNPAIRPDSTVIILSPNIYFDIGTNTFGLKNVFSRKAGNDNKKYFDLNYIIDHSEDENFLYGTLDYSLLFMGKIMSNGFYATFSVNEKNNYNFLVPKDLFEFSLGNADYEAQAQRNFDWEGLSVNGISYTSYSFGLLKEFGSDFQFGLHLKLLDAKYVTVTSKIAARIKTGNDFDQVYIEADIRYKQSAPGLNDDHNEEVYFSAGNLSQPFFLHNNLFKNSGFACDFGFHYSPDDKTSVLGSVTDIGFIKWNAEQRELHYKCSYNLTVCDLASNSECLFDLNESINTVIDSIKNVFEPVLDRTDPFRTRITPRILFGLSRTISRHFELLGLFRAGIYSCYTDYRYTLGTIYKLSPNLHLSFSTSCKNNRIGNFGAGMVCRIKGVEMFLSSENVESLIANSSSINVSFGLNFILLNVGYHKK